MSPAGVHELVLDCSAALSWVLPDESSDRTDALLRGLHQDDKIWIPALWWSELSNALVTAQRRGRLRPADVALILATLPTLPLYVDPLLGCLAAERCAAVAATHGLSAYDASYLELAQRRGIGLLTLDRDLAAAAESSGVELL